MPPHGLCKHGLRRHRSGHAMLKSSRRLLRIPIAALLTRSVVCPTSRGNRYVACPLSAPASSIWILDGWCGQRTLVTSRRSGNIHSLVPKRLVLPKRSSTVASPVSSRPLQDRPWPVCPEAGQAGRVHRLLFGPADLEQASRRALDQVSLRGQQPLDHRRIRPPQHRALHQSLVQAERRGRRERSTRSSSRRSGPSTPATRSPTITGGIISTPSSSRTAAAAWAASRRPPSNDRKRRAAACGVKAPREETVVIALHLSTARPRASGDRRRSPWIPAFAGMSGEILPTSQLSRNAAIFGSALSRARSSAVGSCGLSRCAFTMQRKPSGSPLVARN